MTNYCLYLDHVRPWHDAAVSHLCRQVRFAASSSRSLQRSRGQSRARSRPWPAERSAINLVQGLIDGRRPRAISIRRRYALAGPDSSYIFGCRSSRCAENHFLPGAVLTKSYVETGDGQPFVMTKLIGSPSEVARESCGGRRSRDPLRSPGSATRCEIASNQVARALRSPRDKSAAHDCGRGRDRRSSNAQRAGVHSDPATTPASPWPCLDPDPRAFRDGATLSGLG